MIRRPPRSTHCISSAASDVYKRQLLEIRVEHASVKISKLQLKAIKMKAEADGITIEKFCKALARETRQYYLANMYPTKVGPNKAYREESGKWRMEGFDGRSQRYTLQNVLEMNLYIRTRAYLMSLAMSETTKDRKGWKPETIILREDDRVAIVKEGKLKLHSWDNWFKTNPKKTTSREK